MSERPSRPPFWGIKLFFQEGAHVLIVDDDPDRYEALAQLMQGCRITWAVNLNEVRLGLDRDGSYDIYSLDYDLAGTVGGWLPAAHLIRERDPMSVGKVVIVHSANPDAYVYRNLFPAAIVIQWNVLSTIAGVSPVSAELVQAILTLAGPGASAEALREAANRLIDESG